MLLFLFLIIGQAPAVEATDIVQRLNYGEVFHEEAGLYVGQEHWLHTF